jgi:hypothetical protein
MQKPLEEDQRHEGHYEPSQAIELSKHKSNDGQRLIEHF